MNPTNELKPLLSEDGLSNMIVNLNGRHFTKIKRHGPAAELARDVRNLYEAERAKTHALVQQLVDALEATKHKPDWWRHHPSEEWIYDVIADAAEQGFKPFQP